MYKIEKNLPIPEKETKIFTLKYPFPEMETGDSFFVSIDEIKDSEHNNPKLSAEQRESHIDESQDQIINRLRSCMAYFRKKHPKRRFTLVRVDKGVRCWRIV